MDRVPWPRRRENRGRLQRRERRWRGPSGRCGRAETGSADWFLLRECRSRIRTRQALSHSATPYLRTVLPSDSPCLCPGHPATLNTVELCLHQQGSPRRAFSVDAPLATSYPRPATGYQLPATGRSLTRSPTPGGQPPRKCLIPRQRLGGSKPICRKASPQSPPPLSTLNPRSHRFTPTPTPS